MKRILVWVIISSYLAFLGLFIFLMVNSPIEEKELKFEPIEKQIRVSEEVSTQEIMDKIVTSSDVFHQKDIGFTFEESQMLMKMAMAEAGAEGVDGKAMVMAVILNRVEDPRFPDSIEGVIFQEHQFSPITDGRYENAEPDVECHLALAEIERGEFDAVDALYFENASESWQADNCKYLGTIGHHRFYK